jgi:outer membrane protein TolC
MKNLKIKMKAADLRGIGPVPGRIILLLACTLVLHTLNGLTPAFSQVDSLETYKLLALRDNPSVKNRFYEYEAALRKIPQAASLPDPQLDIGVFLTPMELLGGKQVADLKLMQMFPWFGVLKNASDQMSMMARMKYEAFRDEKLRVAYEVQSTWYELFRLRGEISISENSLANLATIRALAVAGYRSSGPSAGLQDIYRIDIETAGLKDDIETMRDQERASIIRLNGIINRPLHTKVFTDQALQPDTLGLLAVDSYNIPEGAPMLGMIRFEKEAFKAGTKMSQRMGYPMLGLGISYSVIKSDEMNTTGMNGNDMVMPMVSITLPLYRKKYRAQREESEQLLKAAEEKYVAAGIGLRNDLTETLNRCYEENRKLKLYEQQAKLVSATLNIALAGYSSGSAGLNDVLMLRQQLLDYELRKIRALTGLNTSMALLRRFIPSDENK